MASRKPEDLHPDILPKYNMFIQGCKEQGIDVILTCTYRSPEEQNVLYAQGRTSPGRIVTMARAGESKHNFMLSTGKPAAKAFDIVPIRAGKPLWGTKGDDLVVWEALGKIGAGVGLQWAGLWKNFKEYPHFEIK